MVLRGHRPGQSSLRERIAAIGFVLSSTACSHCFITICFSAYPAARLGRFTRTAKVAETKGTALTAIEVQAFLNAAREICEDYYPLFLTAFRAGLRSGELVALRWATFNSEPTRLTQTASFWSSTTTCAGVFRSPDGSILDPDNLYHRYFLPVLVKAGIRKIRLHDRRHTFGSLLIQNGASLVYVKEQMGHSSIQVTVEIYGHLIPGANVSFVDTLDSRPDLRGKTSPQQNATPAQQAQGSHGGIPSEIVDLIGGGGWTRTNDLRIMRCAFRGAATWIQSLPVGSRYLIRGQMRAVGT